MRDSIKNYESKLLGFACALFISFLTLHSSLVTPVSAHLAGQPPFFVINKFYSNLYPVPLTSLPDFPLPQDMAPNSYVINQPLDMYLDENVLPAPKAIIEKTDFTWEFGDGTKGTGLSNTHAYKTPGSFLLKIYADDGSVPTPQLLESALINVLPNKDYQLPQAIIKVNGQTSRDPLTDVLHFPMGDEFNFDATSSKASSSSIKSYFWDWGDQKSSTISSDKHSYPKDTTQVFIVLRVTDNNGFYADNFVEVENGKYVAGENSSQSTSSPVQKTKASSPKWIYLAAIILLLGILLIMVRLSARGRGRGRRR